MLRKAQDCRAPELMLVGQAGVLEALVALEALMLLLSRTLGLPVRPCSTRNCWPHRSHLQFWIRCPQYRAVLDTDRLEVDQEGSFTGTSSTQSC